jgi:hypothetical protein
MTQTAHKSEFALVIFFLAVVFSVPIAQTSLELFRGERVQFTDAFMSRPKAANLRQYEKTLEEKSWFQQQLRPHVQGMYFEWLNETGAKAMLGLDGWLFYRPDVRYLLEPDRTETDNSGSAWVRPSDGWTRRDSVLKAILQYHALLKERGIELLVVPVPGKPAIYPDKATSRLAAANAGIPSPTDELLKALERQGVATVDLFKLFREQRKPGFTNNTGLYLARDTHWTPAGAQLAAQCVARKLLEMGWVKEGNKEFKTRRITVKRNGDILDMMQIPGALRRFPAEAVECEQVIDPVLGMMVPSPSDRPGAYKYPTQPSTLLVLGDSFCRIYQLPEPKSLGEISVGATEEMAKKDEASTRKLLPGSAGFLAHLALAMKSPVDSIVSDGGASTDVRKRLSMNPEILEGKKVVIWEFIERDVQSGRDGWELVALPRNLTN